MSAIPTTLFALLKSGDHIIITDDAYRRTLEFCKTSLVKFDIECTVAGGGLSGQAGAELTSQAQTKPTARAERSPANRSHSLVPSEHPGAKPTNKGGKSWSPEG